VAVFAFCPVICRDSTQKFLDEITVETGQGFGVRV
jgi:hypothetical protein